MDYQKDVRLAVRDELPTDINAEDITESLYSQVFLSELTWSPIFYVGWAAFEPDVSVYLHIYLFHLVTSTFFTTHGKKAL